MDYESSIKNLTSTNKFKINLGLERIRKVLKLLGNPQDKLKVIHVAGTNGKGSVCAILANILKCSGYKTGLYTSPHLVEYTERIKIDNEQITPEEFAILSEIVCEMSEKNNIELTEFEILTVMAFKYFYDNGVDIAVIETGLGGRLDATNVCDKPLCSIITSVSLEHTDILGKTIEQIAFEKSGIIKERGNVIAAGQNCGYKVIETQAKQHNANLVTVKGNIKTIFKNNVNYAIIDKNQYEFGLIGSYQEENLALVVAAVELLNGMGYKLQLEEGLRTVKWHARLEYIREQNILVDGAHNPQAAKELLKSIDYYFPNEKRIFIYGTINTKDYKTIARTLFRESDEIYYYEFNHNKAVSYEEYKRVVSFLPNVKKYTREVMDRKELKIVTGSLYMIGEFVVNYFVV